MVTLQISLPEELAKDAQEMGLLEANTIAEILQEEIRRRAFEYIFSVADRLAAAGDIPMTPEEVQAEIRAAREEENAVRP